MSASMTPEKLRADVAHEQEFRNKEGFSSFFKFCSDAVVESVVRDQKLRFTQPRALNDPLEFDPILHFSNDRDSRRAYNLNGVRLPSIEAFWRVQVIESQINAYGVLSLTKLPYSFEMWSHYASGHKGFLIEFKPDFWKEPCMKSKTGPVAMFGEVEYVRDYSANLDRMADSTGWIPPEVLLKELFFRKTSRWSHEKEYRLVRTLADSPQYTPPSTPYSYTDLAGMYLFDFDWKKCVNSVVLGASMEKAKKKLIAQYCISRGTPLYQSMIFKDQADWLGEPCSLYLLPLTDAQSRQKALDTPSQLLCTDSLTIAGEDPVKTVSRLEDLPYYKGHESIVRDMYRNLTV